MIAFETKCWENDFLLMLKYGRLEKMIKRCSYKFKEINLIINNVKNRKKVEELARQKVDKGVITNYYFVEDFEREVLKFYNIDRESFGKGYYYSIAELVGLYVCQCNYLLHFSSDSIPQKSLSNTWINKSIELFKKNPLVYVANLTWNYKYYEAENEAFSKIDDFFLGYGFSDQNYLINVENFKGLSFNELNEYSDRYPKYADNLFEKRVDAWMRNNHKIRATFAKGSYIHKNIPAKLIEQWIYNL